MPLQPKPSFLGAGHGPGMVVGVGGKIGFAGEAGDGTLQPAESRRGVGSLDCEFSSRGGGLEDQPMPLPAE